MGGKKEPLSLSRIAALVGCTEEEAGECIEILEASGWIRRSGPGVWALTIPEGAE